MSSRTATTHRPLPRWPALAMLFLSLATAADARVLLTVDAALALAFDDGEVTRESVFLTEEELAHAVQLAGVDVASALVARYHGLVDGIPATAYLDVHIVRTLEETVMVVVDGAGTIGRVEVLSFDEPPDYQPRRIWYDQLHGRSLDDELAVKRAIPPVAGATLTAHVTVAATRRVLALHRVIEARETSAIQREAPATGATSEAIER